METGKVILIAVGAAGMLWLGSTMLESNGEKLADLALTYRNTGEVVQPDKYLDLISSGKGSDLNPYMVAYFKQLPHPSSSCGLVVRGLWRKMGLKDDRLGPYKPGYAINNLVEIAKSNGAYVDGYHVAQGQYTPKKGDMGYVAEPEHVFTIIDVKPKGKGYLLTTIDGGQVDGNGRQIITKREREWQPMGNLFADIPHGGGTQKTVLGIVNVAKLPF